MTITTFTHRGKSFAIEAVYGEKGITISCYNDVRETVAQAFVDYETICDGRSTGNDLVTHLAYTLRSDIQNDRPFELRMAQLLLAIYEAPSGMVLRLSTDFVLKFLDLSNPEQATKQVQDGARSLGFEVLVTSGPNDLTFRRNLEP